MLIVPKFSSWIICGAAQSWHDTGSLWGNKEAEANIIREIKLLLLLSFLIQNHFGGGLNGDTYKSSKFVPFIEGLEVSLDIQ